MLRSARTMPTRERGHVGNYTDCWETHKELYLWPFLILPLCKDFAFFKASQLCGANLIMQGLFVLDGF